MPSDKACVAFIYGPKGSAIIDMEQQSRCRIVFDKEPIKVSNCLSIYLSVYLSVGLSICQSFKSMSILILFY